MKRLLVCQHVAFEILGTLNPLLKSCGFRVKYVNFGRDPEARPSLDGYDGLVVLGGPMSAFDDAGHPHLATEVELVQRAIERDLPVLGICLGAQIIARALGAAVRPNRVKEIGWYDLSLRPEGRSDPLFAHFGPTERVFQWHGDTFDLPARAVPLASSRSCENQAFRHGDSVYGLQFHLEVDEALLHRWLSVPVHLAELEELHGEIDPDTIRCETAQRMARNRQLADQTFLRFIELLGPARPRPQQPHR